MLSDRTCLRASHSRSRYRRDGAVHQATPMSGTQMLRPIGGIGIRVVRRSRVRGNGLLWGRNVGVVDGRFW